MKKNKTLEEIRKDISEDMKQSIQEKSNKTILESLNKNREIMNQKIIKLKHLIEDYEELSQEADDMSRDWNEGSPEAAAMSDPSDQFMKGQELEEKYNEIKELLKEF